jgi:hypothetical protein
VNWGKNEELNETWVETILRTPIENDLLEFKSNLQLFRTDGKLADHVRDEFIKDILGLANGNSQTIRKTKYLVIGLDDSEFDENKMRVRHSIDYRLPSQSEIAKWIFSACTPAVVGLNCETIKFKNDQLFVITIPPTFDLHETTRELIASGGKFQKHTVFMRQDEHTVTASVRDGVSIQELKHLYRQEVANPPAILIGVLAGGIVAFIIGNAKIQEINLLGRYSDVLLKVVYSGLGILFGAFIGWIIRVLNETRYDWRYLSLSKRIYLVVAVVLILLSSFYLKF